MENGELGLVLEVERGDRTEELVKALKFMIALAHSHAEDFPQVDAARKLVAELEGVTP